MVTLWYAQGFTLAWCSYWSVAGANSQKIRWCMLVFVQHQIISIWENRKALGKNRSISRGILFPHKGRSCQPLTPLPLDSSVLTRKMWDVQPKTSLGTCSSTSVARPWTYILGEELLVEMEPSSSGQKSWVSKLLTFLHSWEFMLSCCSCVVLAIPPLSSSRSLKLLLLQSLQRACFSFDHFLWCREACLILLATPAPDTKLTLLEHTLSHGQRQPRYQRAWGRCVQEGYLFVWILQLLGSASKQIWASSRTQN